MSDRRDSMSAADAARELAAERAKQWMASTPTRQSGWREWLRYIAALIVGFLLGIVAPPGLQPDAPSAEPPAASQPAPTPSPTSEPVYVEPEDLHPLGVV